MILPIAMTTTGAAALINFWLAFRCGQVRTAEKILVGDGGNLRLIARMRAHANFCEYAPIVLILIALTEFAAGTSLWLWITASVFLIGRVAHGLGMDGLRGARLFGTLTTMLIMVGLALNAVALPLLAKNRVTPAEVVPVG